MNRLAEPKSDRIQCRYGQHLFPHLDLPAMLVAGFLLVALGGCNSSKSTSATRPVAKAKPPATLSSKIVAQGQILPKGGLIRLAATPGDIVDRIDVGVGDPVTRGRPLMTMRSLKVHEARLQALQSRLQDAKQQQDNAIEQARLRLKATELKLDQITVQTKALDRQVDILRLAEKQVTASQKVFEQLSSIAKDPLTRDFVGTLQLEQQQILVNDAQLKYRQQAESFRRSKEAAEFENVAAEQERRTANLALQVAQSSLAVASIESELKALDVQQQSSILVAPQAAVVVAINARVGEAATQFPLIELADESKVICEVEVVETDAARIAPGQIARISSPALPTELHGKVLNRGPLVGRPQLAVADPLAKADYRSVVVTVEIDPPDVPIASKWLQLQVSVEIEIIPLNSLGTPASPVAVPQP